MATKSFLFAAFGLSVALSAGAAQAGDYHYGHRDHNGSHHSEKMRLRAGVVYGGQRRYHHGAPRYRSGNLYAGPYAGRTEFCRYEYRIRAYSGRRVKVKRCIWVRNDLLGVYAADGWWRD